MGFLDKLLDFAVDAWDSYRVSQVYPTLQDAMHKYLNAEGYELMECTPFSARLEKQGAFSTKTVTLTVKDDGSVYIVESGLLGEETVFPKTAGAPTPQQFQQMLQESEEEEEETLPDLKKCYAILGCDPSVSDAELTKCYRQLSKQYHPDRISAKNLAPDFIKFAKAKFQEIQNAYDTITEHRKS